MSPILSSLMALSLLAHSLLGCCWHHAHACEDNERHEVSHDFSGGHCHANGWATDCHGDQGLCRANHAEHNNCQGTRCVFVGVLRVVVSWPLQTLGQASAAGVAHVVAPCRTRSMSGPAPDAAAASLPLRIHLLYQILLI
jgi:hypothetical protein